MKEKFCVGDVVEITNSFWYGELNEGKEDIGTQAIITEVDTTPIKQYALFHIKDGNETAWWNDDQIRFIRRSKRGELEQLKKKFSKW